MSLYATPRLGLTVEDCYFYHTIDLPKVGVVKGDWDIRNVDDYLGRVDLSGKHVLEIGPASGFLTLTMEKRGADVVGFDLNPDHFPDNLISDSYDRTAYLDGYRTFQLKLNNAFWFTHEAFSLNAKVVHGSVYRIPKAIGEFDVGTMCCVLTHLSDPFAAMCQTLARVKHTAIITEMLAFDTKSLTGRLLTTLVNRLFRDKRTVPPVPMFFYPHRSVDRHHYTWWRFTPDSIVRMLSLLGFRTAHILIHVQGCCGQEPRLFTVVAERENPGYCTLAMTSNLGLI